MSKITIAIDGYSSTGKSTIARQLAKTLGYIYVDSGAMYRAVTLYALQAELIRDGQLDKEELIESLPSIFLHFTFNPKKGFAEVYLNNKNVESDIRNLEVSKYVSLVAEIPEVRRKLVAIQQEMGKNKGVVMDGRDIGTVVFPEADLKLFLNAAPHIRATRRYKELLERGDEVTFEEVLQNVELRDRIDSTREASPLKQAEDAIVIDNTDMGLKEQFERVLNLTNRVIDQKKKDA
ncbi:MAG: (d)CMP kinase [Flavobacteriaceae bacterium]|nr:(d)CMP kinase [Flavobacteriaceae bacterium]